MTWEPHPKTPNWKKGIKKEKKKFLYARLSEMAIELREERIRRQKAEADAKEKADRQKWL